MHAEFQRTKRLASVGGKKKASSKLLQKMANEIFRLLALQNGGFPSRSSKENCVKDPFDNFPIHAYTYNLYRYIN